jgi:hypothetical protein
MAVLTLPQVAGGGGCEGSLCFPLGPGHAAHLTHAHGCLLRSLDPACAACQRLAHDPTFADSAKAVARDGGDSCRVESSHTDPAALTYPELVCLTPGHHTG